jgi:ribonuclease HI
MSKSVKVFTDGASRGNPGPAALGIIVYDENDQCLLEHNERLGEQTNNFAEYMAVIRALELAIEREWTVVYVYCDSQLLVRQMLGEYKVKAPQIKPLFEQAKGLVRRLDKVSFTHVRRELNKEADALANLALDSF